MKRPDGHESITLRYEPGTPEPWRAEASPSEMLLYGSSADGVLERMAAALEVLYRKRTAK